MRQKSVLRFLSFLLLAVLCMTLFTGCAGNEPEENPVVPAPEPQPVTPDVPEKEPEKEDENSVEKRLSQMTLEQKVTQMLMPSFRFIRYQEGGDATGMTVLTPEVEALIQQYEFGGIILFSEHFESAQQSKDLIDAMQSAHQAHHQIPLLVATDQEGGSIRRFSFGTYTCGNMALGATGDTDAATQNASLLADELHTLGVNCDFAPVLDVNSDPRNPVIGIRSFSDDPELVAEMGIAYLKGLKTYDVVGCLKHFPGHGDTDVDSHSGLPCVDKSLEELRSLDLLPFQKVIDAGADLLMTAHIQYPALESETYTGANGQSLTLPATLSKRILTDLLRDDMGFEGVVCTDALNMDALKENFSMEDIAKLAIEAGADLLLMPIDYRMPMDEYLPKLEAYIAMVCDLVEKGEISQSRIDESVRRILTLKENHGLFQPSAVAPSDLSTVGSKEHHQLEGEIAEQAITLIKNDGNLLPLDSQDCLLVLVPYSSQINAVTYAAQQLAESGRIPSADAIEVKCFGNMDWVDLEQLVYAGRETYSAVVGMSAMYDMSDLSGGRAQKLDWLFETCPDWGLPTIFISTQLPYDLARFQEADSALACYFGGGMPAIPDYTFNMDHPGFGPNIPAVIRVLYGQTNPTATLPVQIPQLLGSNNEYTLTDTILFDRGYGLTYP